MHWHSVSIQAAQTQATRLPIFAATWLRESTQVDSPGWRSSWNREQSPCLCDGHERAVWSGSLGERPLYGLWGRCGLTGCHQCVHFGREIWIVGLMVQGMSQGALTSAGIILDEELIESAPTSTNTNHDSWPQNPNKTKLLWVSKLGNKIYEICWSQ